MIRIPLISSSLIIQISEQLSLSASSLCCCLRLTGFTYFFFSGVFVRSSLALQHISSRRHKDRAAGKPAKPKFCPYPPTQRHQSFQAVSPLYVHPSPLCLLSASPGKLPSLFPVRRIVSEFVLIQVRFMIRLFGSHSNSLCFCWPVFIPFVLLWFPAQQ